MTEWAKSSYSAGNGACVEWRKACESGTCVEVYETREVILVRDGKNPDGPRLAFSPEEWAQFVDGVKRGDFG